ncbi:MAG: acyl-CoA synthetase [Ilumatobacteraceae bacterium]|nr:acyl-CoA synthetase [Ilumatobacteraceae bacterium]
MPTLGPSPSWNFADSWEAIARAIPDAPAQYGFSHRDGSELHFAWGEFDRRANGVARALIESGATHQDKVAQYMYNCPQYLESIFATFKAGLAPVNTNYRYTPDELVYIWDNADVVAVVFHGSFADTIDGLRQRVPRVALWLWVDDGSGECPTWATDYEAMASQAGAEPVMGSWGRSGDDLLLIYTGGTTGMPKGVMWRQEDLLLALDDANRVKLPPTPDVDALVARTTRIGPRNLPAAPLMHGTGLFNAMSNLMMAGSIVTMRGRKFDPVELLDTIELLRVNSMSIVGDAFAKPILRALDAEPTRWDLSSLRVIISSGVMFAAETKAGLLRHNERLIMVDALGSSEAIGMAQNTTTADGSSKTATFQLGPRTKVLTEEGREVLPGSGELGRVALRGHTPIGYYKDPEKSAKTFVVFDGVRWSIPGDWASVDADGTVQLLGRGSQCINTGGEKVYPEEVEEVLKLHPAVADAAVVGLPDDRFGQAITALVEPLPDRTIVEAELIAHVKVHLAAYKAPKRVLAVDTVGRAGNGKLDYKALTERAAKTLG